MGDRQQIAATPFVGREHEMQVLRAAIEGLAGGCGRLVLLTGEPGIGKTRICEEVAAYARSCGARVLWGRGYEGEGAPPLWPWVQVLRTGVGVLDAAALRDSLGADAADLVPLVPAIREQVPDLPACPRSDSPEARFRLFDVIVRLLERVAVSAPLLIVLDDLHSADRSSLLLLDFVTRALRVLPVLVIGTYRSSAARSAPALSEALVELAREPSTEHRVLRGLNAAEVAQLLEERAGVRPAAPLVTLVHERTEGNPLFVVEFIRALLEQRDVSKISNAQSTIALAVPRGVKRMIERRLAAHSACCRQVLQVAAVVGRTFERQLVVTVLPLAGLAVGREWSADAVVTEALEEAAAAGLIDAIDGSWQHYRFTHALIRETLYEALRPAERAQLHGQVGDAIERLPDRDDHLSELAYHFSEASCSAPGSNGGSADKAIHYVARAGERSMALLAYEEAARLYEVGLRVLDCGATTDGDQTRTTERCRLLVALGEAQQHAGETEASKQTMLRGAALAEALGERDLLARAALRYGTQLPWGEGSQADPVLVQLLEKALAGWGDEDNALHAMLAARLATALAFTAERDRGWELSQQALAMARHLDDPAALAYALNARHAAAWEPNNLEERLAIASELIALGEQLQDREIALQGRMWRVNDLYELGDRGRLDAEMALCRQLHLQLHQPLYAWWFANFTVAPCMLEGRFAEAAERAQQALRMGEGVNAGAPLAYGSQMFALHWTRGDGAALASMVESFEAWAAVSSGFAMVRAALALIYRETNCSREASVYFEQLAQADFSAIPRDQNWLPCLSYAVEVCTFLGDAPRAVILHDLLAPFALRAVTFAGMGGYYGPVAHYLGMLATVLCRWEDAARHFEAAIEMNTRMRARPWLARTQYEHAVMLQARGAAGDTARAAALLTDALATAQALDMPLVIERVQALQQRVGSSIADEPAPPSAPPPSPTAAVFRCEGQYWSVGFGGRIVRVKQTKGVQYIAHLLRHPGQDFLALDLMQTSNGGTHAGPGPDGGEPLLDARARAAYRTRLQELREELEEAERCNDLGRVTRLQAERQALAEQLHSALGLSGRGRRNGSAAERARSTVGKRIRDALNQIAALHPPIGHHLRACVKTGYVCSYTPSPGQKVAWDL
jgi:hypothetical protein